MGNEYRGEVVNEFTKEGKGEIIYAKDQAQYKGDFVQNVKQGRGELILGNGDKYMGEF